MSRDLSAVYNAYTIGGSNDTTAEPVGKYRFFDNYTSAFFQIEFILKASSDSDLASKLVAARAALRAPRARLQVTQGGQTLIDWDPTTASVSAYDAEPELEKVGQAEDSGRAQRLRFTVRFKRVADLSGQSGRRESGTQLLYTLQRRRIVVITGTYTTYPGATARAQYNAQIAAFATTQLAAIDGAATWTLGGEDARDNDSGTELVFRREYWEVTSTGRREGDVDVSYSPARVATVTMKGVYVKTGGTAAKTLYTANEATHAAATLSALGVTNAELVSEQVGQNEQNEFCPFTRVYQEIIHQQNVGTTNDTSIVKDTIVVASVRTAPGDSPLPSAGATRSSGTPVKRLIELEARYEAWIDKTLSTDLRSKWTALRGHVQNLVATKLGLSGSIIVSERFEPNVPENKIVARLQLVGLDGDLFALRVKTSKFDRKGKRLSALMDGQDHSYLKSKVPPLSTMTRTVEARYRVGGSFKLETFFQEQMAGWELMTRTEPDAIEEVVGVYTTVTIRTAAFIEVWQRADKVTERSSVTVTGR